MRTTDNNVTFQTLVQNRTITFNFNGNGQGNQTRSVPNNTSWWTFRNRGTATGVPAQPSRANHSFVGWFNTSAASGGTNINNMTGNITGNHTLWARWFMHRDGWVTASSLNVRRGPGTNHGIVRHISRNVQVRVVGESGNWWRLSCGNYVSKNYITFTRPATRTITFNFNGNGQANATRTALNGTSWATFRSWGTVSGRPAQPTRAGHTFVGWFNTSAATGGTNINNMTGNITGNHTFWARWNRVTPTPPVTTRTITFNFNGNGQASVTRTASNGTSWAAFRARGFATGRPPAPNRPGFVFAGWFNTSAGTGGTNINNMSGNITGNHTFWARWTRPIPATGVRITTQTRTLLVGHSHRFAANVTPANATNRSVRWESNAPSIASIDQSGLLRAHRAGIVQITAITVCGARRSTVTVTVQMRPHESIRMLEGQQMSRWCWVAAARMFNNHYLTANRTQSDAVINEIGRVRNEAGSPARTYRAANFFAYNAAGSLPHPLVMHAYQRISEANLLRFLRDGHVVLIRRGRYDRVDNPRGTRDGGHFYVVTYYRMVNGVAQFTVICGWPVPTPNWPNYPIRTQGRVQTMTYNRMVNDRNYTETGRVRIMDGFMVVRTSYANQTLDIRF